jgi:transposase
LTAPFVVDGPVNGPLFPGYGNQVLVPALSEGDIVAMDNLGAHEVPGVPAATEAVGARVMYRPADSPDLNPIETVFARIRSTLRKMAIRTVGEPWDALGSLVDRVTATECQNFLRHAGDFQSA